MLSRRRFLASATVVSGIEIGLNSHLNATQPVQQKKWFMPDEAEPHKRTWMAFGASEKVWGKKLLPEVRRNLATIARTIAKYEQVSMLVNDNEFDLARKLVGPGIELIRCPLDDLWIRDTGPVFLITKQGEKAAVDFNFNGWGEKQEFGRDAKIAKFVTQLGGVHSVSSHLVLEGGGVEVDGHGTAIFTESCVLNANRNPGVTKKEAEAELKNLLGLTKIIWLPGVKGKDITDGHTDFYARFVQSGVVVAGYDPDPASFDHAVTKTHLKILRGAKDAQGRALQVVLLEGPKTVRKPYETTEFAAGYINFYVCNGAVIVPEFGDANADKNAKKKLQSLFPNRVVVQINIDGIAAGGGGIHCTTQQEPKV